MKRIKHGTPYRHAAQKLTITSEAITLKYQFKVAADG